MKTKLSTLLFGFLVFLAPFAHAETVSPAAVGWGNLVVPGLGASLRGLPGRGLLEASTEIGTFYGGTFYGKEGSFRIDGTVLVPDNADVFKPVVGGIMQEFGLKLHMYNTFYNYQQASLDPGNAELEKEYEQPLYKGAWDDVLLAPFKWKNLEKPYVYLPIILGTGFVYLTYLGTPIASRSHASSSAEDALYGTSAAISLPLGSSFGEEVLFRGFMQREIRHYTHSVVASIGAETLVFTLLHPPDLRPAAFAGGIYFGLITNYFAGDLEPGIAAHFWTDFVNGVFVYFLFRQSEHKSVPLAANVSIPF